MEQKVIVEVCCGSVDDCVVAARCGADRIELNHALELDGMTPSTATLRRAKELVDLPICCMVRPRGFGFCYSEEHYRVMKMEAEDLLKAGADGIVFGFLKEDSSIDVERTKEMVELVHPKEAIFHKAFDATEDLEASLQILIDCGVDRVLTSAKGSSPDIPMLKFLQEKYGDQIQLLPGGGVREHNVNEIVRETGIYQIHTSAKHMVLDPSTWNTSNNKDTRAHSYAATSEEALTAIIKKTKER